MGEDKEKNWQKKGRRKDKEEKLANLASRASHAREAAVRPAAGGELHRRRGVSKQCEGDRMVERLGAHEKYLLTRFAISAFLGCQEPVIRF